MKFLHVADIHLGCRRYNLEERTKDFFRAWHDVITNHAIPNRVDFMLIAGDFFDRRNIDPQAMNHAIAGLKLLKEADIPVIAIEGNHDQHNATSDFRDSQDERTHSWLRSLSDWGYLKLLEPTHNAEKRMTFLPWDEEENVGSYIDIAGARIFGSYWYGTSTTVALTILADALRDAHSEGRFNILMLHTDVEGHTSRPTIPAVPVAKLKELKQLVNYVALGHTHKRFDLDGWAFNPGSLEPTSIDEYKEERGAFLVEVDERHHITVQHIREYVQRPFQRLSFDVSGVEDAEAVHAGVMQMIEREARTHNPDSEQPAPIVEINLRGHLGFKNSLLQINRMRDEARERTNALHVMIRNQSVPVEYAVAAGLDAQAPRHERERRIIEDLISRDNRYKHRAHEIAELVIEAKRQALGNEQPDKILELIARKLDQPDGKEKAEATGGDPAPTAAALNAIERNAVVSGQ